MKTEVLDRSAHQSPRSSSSSTPGPIRSTFGIPVAAMLLFTLPAFDGQKAWDLVDEQVAFGSRVPGTAAHVETREWILDQLRDWGAQVTLRPFMLRNPLTGDSVSCVNLVASFRESEKERIFVGAHWDSRAYADRDPDPARRKDPVPGANDGASGVAVLLELARLMSETPPPLGVDLLFFDGEDQGLYGEKETFCAGSRELARLSRLTGFSPRFGIVIDLIGSRHIRIHPDRRSQSCCPELTTTILAIVERHLPARVEKSVPVDVYDDHIPFIDAGIPTVLLFGAGDPYWHTTSDLPKNVTTRNLKGIGNALVEVIWGGSQIP